MPHARALLGIVEAMAPVMHQHVQHHVLRHAHGEIGIDDAHDRHVGQIRIGEDVIDAGAQRKDRLQTGQAGKQPARRVPGAGIGDVGGIAEVRRPQPNVAPRRQRAQALFPRLRIESGDGEQDRAHQNRVWFAQSRRSGLGQPLSRVPKVTFPRDVDCRRYNSASSGVGAPAPRGRSRSLAYGLPHIA